MKIKSTLLKSSFVLTSFLLLFSCGGKKADSFSSEQDISPVPCVVLLPVEVPDNDKGSSTNNLDAGAEYLNGAIRDELTKSKVGKLIDSSQIRHQISGASGGKLGIIKEVGSRAECNYVLITTLRNFTQRQGGEFAVDTPASTAFQMRLVEASTGNSLWGSNFSEKQASLMSNLFSFGKAQSRGFKWITVEELASQGVHEKLSESPYFN